MPIHDPLLSMAYCLGVTLLTELCFAALFGLRQIGEFAVVALANLTTNPLLVSLTLVVRLSYGYLLSLIALTVLELCAFFSEGAVYRALLTRQKRPFFLSFVLNAASLVLGALLNRLLF